MRASPEWAPATAGSLARRLGLRNLLGADTRRWIGGAASRLWRHVAGRRVVYSGLTALIGVAILASVVAIAQKQDKVVPPAPATPVPLAQTAPASPQRIETTAHGAWNVTCRYFAEASIKPQCAGVLRVTETKNNQLIFAYVLSESPQGQLIVAFQTPTGVLVQQGVELKFGEGEVRRVPFTSCDPQHCDASTPIDDAFAKEALASATAVATIYSKDGRNVRIEMNQSGIDKVIESLRQ